MRYTQHFKAFATLTHVIYTVDKIYEDDKLDWDDTPTIMAFIGGEIVIWGADFLDWRKVSKKPLYVIEAAILAGGVASFAIGGREGLVGYTDILTGKVSPAKWYETVAPEVEKVVRRKVDQLKLFGNMLWFAAERQLERTGFDLKYPYII